MKKPTQIILRCAFLLILLLTFALLLRFRTQHTAPRGEIILASNEMREAWLNLRGWKVSEPEISETRIPEEWLTQPGQNWLKLQHAQGLSPERYAGCDAVRCLYAVENGANAYYCAELLLCGDVLVGAQIYDASTQIMQSVF